MRQQHAFFRRVFFLSPAHGVGCVQVPVEPITTTVEIDEPQPVGLLPFWFSTQAHVASLMALAHATRCSGP